MLWWFASLSLAGKANTFQVYFSPVTPSFIVPFPLSLTLISDVAVAGRWLAHGALSAHRGPASQTPLTVEQGVGGTPLCKQACPAQKCGGFNKPGTTFNQWTMEDSEWVLFSNHLWADESARSPHSQAYPRGIEPQLPMVVASSTTHHCIGFSSSPVQSAQLFTSVFRVHSLSPK